MRAARPKEMTIGALAKAGGVNVETVRYYQRLALLPKPPRTYGGIRRYPRETLQRLLFIRRAQQLGFSLDEVALLLKLGEGLHCNETRELAERKLASVEEKIADLAALQKVLAQLVTACGKQGSSRGCPIIESLVEGQGESPISNLAAKRAREQF